jgi:hypothetical protein
MNMNTTKTKKTEIDYKVFKGIPLETRSIWWGNHKICNWTESILPRSSRTYSWTVQESCKQKHWWNTRLVPRKQNIIIEAHRGEKWCPIWTYQEDHQGEPRKTARQKKSPEEREEKSKNDMANKLVRGCKDEYFTMETNEAWKVYTR